MLVTDEVRPGHQQRPIGGVIPRDAGNMFVGGSGAHLADDHTDLLARIEPRRAKWIGFAAAAMLPLLAASACGDVDPEDDPDACPVAACENQPTERRCPDGRVVPTTGRCRLPQALGTCEWEFVCE